MRSSSLILFPLAVVWMTAGVAQEPPDEALRELLCEQCPFDAPVNPIRRDIFPPFRAISVVTAEDMRALGLISVADMVERLRNSVAEETESSQADASSSDNPGQTAEEGHTDYGEAASEVAK